MSDNRTLAKGAMIGGAPIYYQEESTTDTTMPSTSFFKTEDVNGKPVIISRDNIMGIVKDCLGSILNGESDQTTVTKVPTLNGNTLGASAVSTMASVLGALTFKGGVTSADNITTPGIYYDTTTGDVFAGYQCYIFHLKVGNYGDMQIAVAYYGAGIKTRILGGPWNDV